MIDFTSSLYLGWSANHLQEKLPITDGKPSILQQNALKNKLEYQLKIFTGSEAIHVAPSTLHIFTDLVGMLHPPKHVLLCDQQMYPAFDSAKEQAKGRGIQLVHTQHYSPRNLAKAIRKYAKGKIPVMISTGFSTNSGKKLPIQGFLKVLAPYQGWLIIDDTQAFGLLGPKGKGILGTPNLRRKPKLLVVNSMAKAFGVPIAFLAGSSSFLKKYKRNARSETYNSPVSNWHLNAALQMLSKNQIEGDQARKLIHRKVKYVKEQLRQLGFHPNPGLFPYVMLNRLSKLQSINIWKWLKRKNIHTVLVKGHDEHTPNIVFLIRTDHSYQQLNHLLHTLKTKMK